MYFVPLCCVIILQKSKSIARIFVFKFFFVGMMFDLGPVEIALGSSRSPWARYINILFFLSYKSGHVQNKWIRRNQQYLPDIPQATLSRTLSVALLSVISRVCFLLPIPPNTVVKFLKRRSLSRTFDPWISPVCSLHLPACINMDIRGLEL